MTLRVPTCTIELGRRRMMAISCVYGTLVLQAMVTVRIAIVVLHGSGILPTLCLFCMLVTGSEGEGE